MMTTRLRVNPARPAQLIALLVIVGACGFDAEVVQVTRPVGGPAEVRLVFRADSLSEAAAMLGWGEVIPDAEVTLAPVDSLRGAPRTTRTDQDGVALFTDVESGLVYRVSVSRPFTAEEVELTRTTGVTAVDDGFTLLIDRPELEEVFAPMAGRRRELVISEFYFREWRVPGVGLYEVGGFIELYNNSDTTIHLDGMYIGDASTGNLSIGACSVYAPLRNESRGLWTLRVQQIPGTGAQYPLPPGRTAVIATSAIDHTEFVDELLDLSGADFEFAGEAKPDNPAVPNMIDRSPWPNPLRNGLGFNPVQSVPFVAKALDFDALERQVFAGANAWALFPIESVLDVAVFAWDDEQMQWCPGPMIHPSIDRKEGYYNVSLDWLRSIRRRVAVVLPDGRAVLQHTRTSERDFFLGERAPGAIP
jgi:hypothetical protein